MARYRKVEIRIWNDAKFREFSDDGKLVFFYLITNPNMTSLGAMRATLSGLAEEIGWPLERFTKAFGEPFRKGMVKHDPKACFLWLPNFIKYNMPENPNVVRSWPKVVDLLPECDQLTQCLQTVKGFMEGLHKEFTKAFEEALPKVSLKGMPIPDPDPEPFPDPKPEPQHKGDARGDTPKNSSDSLKLSDPELDALHQEFNKATTDNERLLILDQQRLALRKQS